MSDVESNSERASRIKGERARGAAEAKEVGRRRREVTKEGIKEIAHGVSVPFRIMGGIAREGYRKVTSNEKKQA